MRTPSVPSAPAHTVFGFTPRLEGLETRDTPTVTFHGGSLLAAVQDQPVYYGSGWTGSTTPATTDAFNGVLVGGAYMDALNAAGYGVGRGTAAAGVADGLALASGSTISDASIQSRLTADIASGLLPTNTANRLYVVYVQPNVAVSLGGSNTTANGILGYHGAFAGANGGPVRYAVIAYPGGAAHNSSEGLAALDQLTAVTSHEVAEAVTDPDVNYRSLGWYDDTLNGEIGDITENNPNALVRLGGCLVQEVADRNDHLLSIAPPVSPPPSPPPATSGSTTTALTAGPVHYHGWYATTTLTVRVTPPSGTAVPTGTIQLIYNGRVLGTATLRTVNGVATATFNLTFHANGDYTFAARYVGSSVGGSVSPPVTVPV